MSACPYCYSAGQHDRRVCRMRKLHADPEFTKANAERMEEPKQKELIEFGEKP